MSTYDDVAEFAALLTRLKGRTDRSYGSLARRLAMNPSTLHRYCSGDTVPLDFAPVERFAALCGASPEERVELHRRWILAVAARQRTRTPGEPAAPVEPRTSEEPRGSVEPRTSVAPGTAGEPGASSSTVTSPAAGTSAAGRVSEVSAVPDVSSAAGGPPARRRPWYRRRRIAVTTAVAGTLVATLGTLGALSALSADRSPSTAPPSRSPAETTPAPITWTANSQAWTLGCGHDYVIAKSPEQVPPPPAAQDAAPWAASQHAVHGGDTNIEISVQGRTSTAVVLEALRVRVVGRDDPAEGTAYSMDQGCGGSITPRTFSVDLDKDRPIARSVAGSDVGTPIPAVRFPYRVSAQDPEVLLVNARTVTCDCRWYLELDWSSQGRTGTVRIDDAGRPFRTSGIKGLPRFWYSMREWIPRTD
ncbi:helix-turn-helix domain-containing protein [Streptomyces sp. WI04-05B]|uniref:helix-turn-helix domain-containing protein n=1 Tax=Streptomyces TaxID=1883 RepID=UPI0029BA42AE|nr:MULTISPECIES: helix-turn-helix domain-containing protein [unclassified Streptomyces]MDX2543477.1 helix-turn-helix domain-containing protein [Streptomyces sp. WI04-05B]MDX2589146.1 helix-turn-helix domain-containing protein [Streptomyces sp. WI04-05A]